MTPYLNHYEKEHIIQLDIVRGLIAEWADTYGKKKNLKPEDKTFLRYLRTANTWTRKAEEYRRDHLDKDEWKGLYRSVKHLDFQIVPNDKAYKVKERMAKFEDTIIVKTDDWLDWLELIAPYSCGDCNDKDFKGCRIYKLLHKYATPPVNKKDGNACPYSFLAAGYTYGEAVKAVKKGGNFHA